MALASYDVTARRPWCHSQLQMQQEQKQQQQQQQQLQIIYEWEPPPTPIQTVYDKRGKDLQKEVGWAGGTLVDKPPHWRKDTFMYQILFSPGGYGLSTKLPILNGKNKMGGGFYIWE